jgi:iron complex outermembrane receptor protein
VPTLLALQGNPASQSENLHAFEIGYRTQLRSNLSLDIAMFYNSYSQLITAEPGVPYFETLPAPPHLTIPLVFGNDMYGETHGLEVAVNWKPTRRWTLSPGYAWERIHMHLSADSVANGDRVPSSAEGNNPQIQAQLRSTVALGKGLEWNVSAYFVDRLPAHPLPSYTRLDTMLTWRASERLDFSVVGQNLLQDHHVEANSGDQSEFSSFIKRSAYVQLSWRF